MRAILSDRQRELLRWLDNVPRTPMQLGGTDGSHHSATLRALVKKGYAEATGRVRGRRYGLRYRRTIAGKKALAWKPMST